MPVERRKDGSVSIKTNSGVTSVGRVTSAYVNRYDEEKFRQWVEDCSKLVTPGTHTINEIEQYFLEQCDALPIAPSDSRMHSFKYSVIMNHCKHRLKYQAAEFSFDMTDEEIEKWHEEDRAMKEDIRNSSAEELGLVMHGYYLPRTDRNKAFYEEAYQEMKEQMERTNHKAHPIEVADICFFFEERTEVFQVSGGRSFMDQLIVFRGVSFEDIEKRNPRFLGYISSLRDLGKLPDFR
jgi:hypothetical protein